MTLNKIKNRNLDRAEMGGLTIATVTAVSGGTALLASYDVISLKQDASANDIAILPDITTVPMGHRLDIYVVSICELRSDTPLTVGINGGTGSAAELALAAKSHVICIKIAEDNWQVTAIADDFATITQTAAAN